MDPVYGFQAVNVEAQLRTPTSLLRWLRRFIALRKEHPVFGARQLRGARRRPTRGSSPTSAATRTTSCSASTTSPAPRRRSSSTSREFDGRYPDEMFGQTRFPRIGELPYLLTLHPRGFFWFLLSDEEEPRMGLAELDAGIRADPSAAIPADELAEWVVAQRWFGSKSREFAEFNVLDAVVLDAGPAAARGALVEARLTAGTHELYQLPVVTRAADDAPAGGA